MHKSLLPPTRTINASALLPHSALCARRSRELTAGDVHAPAPRSRRAQLATLFKWVREGQIGNLRQHIEREELPQLVLNMADDDGNVLLHHSVKYGHGDCARMIIFAGADVDAPDRQGCTPLMLAVKMENMAVLRLLIESHASLTVMDLSLIHI